MSRCFPVRRSGRLTAAVCSAVVLCLAFAGCSGTQPEPEKAAGSGGVNVAAGSAPDVVITVAGFLAEIPAGSSLSVRAETSAPVDSFSWYLDGTYRPGADGEAFTLDDPLPLGPHRLSCVAERAADVFSWEGRFTVVNAVAGVQP